MNSKQQKCNRNELYSNFLFKNFKFATLHSTTLPDQPSPSYPTTPSNSSMMHITHIPMKSAVSAALFIVKGTRAAKNYRVFHVRS